MSPVSNPLFFNSGRITACLKSEGKQPVKSDALHSTATNGDSSPQKSLTSHVEAGSKLQALAGAKPISFLTSSVPQPLQ